MKLLVYLSSALMLATAAHASNIVRNPSFEDTSGGPLELPGWDAGPFFFRSIVAPPGPQDGSGFAVNVCGGSQDVSLCLIHPLSQKLATTDGTFTLSFWFDLGSSEDDDQNGFSQLTAQWGDQVVFNTGTENTADQGYQFAMIPGLKGSAANGVSLQFFGFNTTDSFLALDNVNVFETEPAPGPTAPEPAGVWLPAGGLLGLVAFAQRRRLVAGGLHR